MYKCSKCAEETRNGYYSYAGEFICKKCYIMEPWHTDRFIIENKMVIRNSPYGGLTEAQQRLKFIEFANNLFGKLSPVAYRLMKIYRKEYTWLAMTRTLEYFYLVKKNPREKAKNNIGIIPFLHDEAQAFYNKENMKIETKMKSFIKSVEQYEKTETRVVGIVEKEKDSKKKIDLNNL